MFLWENHDNDCPVLIPCGIKKIQGLTTQALDQLTKAKELSYIRRRHKEKIDFR